MLKYSQSAFDTAACQSATQAVVPDGALDIPVAVRLRLVDSRITEVETLAVRAGDYAIQSNTAALIASDTTVGWEQSVPIGQRNTYSELTGWLEKFLRMFPAGVCNTTTACRRIENGGGNFGCHEGASCRSGPGPNDNVIPPRLLLADVETGINVGFAMRSGNVWMLMSKMHGGQVHWISVTLGAASTSGWD